MKRIVSSILALLAGLVGFFAFTAWYPTDLYELDSSRQHFDLMSWDEHDEVAPAIQPPLILETNIAEGAVLLFGAEHLNDPTHPQFSALDSAFDEFEPSIVIVEGRPSVLFPLFMDATKSFGESGRLIELAKQGNLPAFSWELSREEEAFLLNEKFSEEQTAMYLLMRPFDGGASASEAEQRMIDIIDDRGHRPGIEGVISDLEGFQTAWSKYIDPQHDWRELKGIHGAPGFLGEMFEYGNDIRDQNLLNIIRELTSDGERVMATMGWSHTVRIERAITQMSQQK